MDRGDAPLTELLHLASRGEPGALDQVFAALYPELRKIAHARLRTDGGGELQSTALVQESFLRLVDSERLAPTDRRHFFAYAAKRRASTLGPGADQVAVAADVLKAGQVAPHFTRGLRVIQARMDTPRSP